MVFVHAGVVAHRGVAIVAPGRSFAGKTTLVRALLGAGATYYSDEYAVVDGEGLVHPYARPLSLRQPGAPGRLRTAPAATLGAATGERPVPIGLVALTHYREGGTWSPESLGPADAALGLLENAVAARSAPERVTRFLSKAAARAVTLEGERGEADEAAAALLAAVERAPATR
jgi:hypothetical protein